MEDGNDEPSLAIQLANNYVLIEPEEPNTTSETGIIMDNIQSPQGVGKIVATGPGLYSTTGTMIPLRFQVGQTVYYSKGSNQEREINGKTYMLIREDSIEYSLV